MTHIFVLDALVVFSVLGLLTLWRRLKAIRARGGLPLPPGPPGLPLVGNIFGIPVTNEYATFRDWSLAYGLVPVSH